MWLPVRSDAGVPRLTGVHSLELQRDSRLNSVCQQMNLESTGESLPCHREERSEEEEEEEEEGLCFLFQLVTWTSRWLPYHRANSSEAKAAQT